jgi:hypothetical protein
VEVGRELPGRIEALRREVLPALFLEDAPVGLVVPVDGQRLALGVVVGAGEADAGGLAGLRGSRIFLDEPAPGADLDELVRPRCMGIPRLEGARS